MSDPRYHTSDALSVPHGFFTRQGGVSSGLYDSLNCGLGSDDTRADVLENRDRVRRALGATDLVTAHQTHSTRTAFIDTPQNGVQADALVTTTPAWRWVRWPPIAGRFYCTTRKTALSALRIAVGAVRLTAYWKAWSPPCARMGQPATPFAPLSGRVSRKPLMRSAQNLPRNLKPPMARIWICSLPPTGPDISCSTCCALSPVSCIAAALRRVLHINARIKTRRIIFPTAAPRIVVSRIMGDRFQRFVCRDATQSGINKNRK